MAWDHDAVGIAPGLPAHVGNVFLLRSLDLSLQHQVFVLCIVHILAEILKLIRSDKVPLLVMHKLLGELLTQGPQLVKGLLKAVKLLGQSCLVFLVKLIEII